MAFKLPVIIKDKKMNVILFVSVTLFVAFLIWKQIKKRKVEKLNDVSNAFDTSTGGNIGTTTETTSSPKKSVITNDTVFTAKSPLPKADQVQWIQHLYNQYRNEAINAGNSADSYPKLALVGNGEDGIYGQRTANAVYRLMGTYSTSWNAFQARVKYYRNNNYQA